MGKKEVVEVVEVVEEVVTLPEETSVTTHLDVDPNDPRTRSDR